MINMTRSFDDLEPLTDDDVTMVNPSESQQPSHVSYIHFNKRYKA